jgi:D-arabinitol dehydrogenase (NADP+)
MDRFSVLRRTGMKSIVIEKPNDIFLIERDVPEPGAREVMIQVMASGICGTDLHIYRGEYMGSYPVIPGHEFSGVVVAVVTGWRWSRISPVTIA